MSITKRSGRLLKIEILGVVFFLSIGVSLLTVMGPTQLACTRSVEVVNCSLSRVSAFGLLQRADVPRIALSAASLDVQIEKRLKADEDSRQAGDESINYYGVKIIGGPNLFLGRHTTDQKSQTEKVDKINQFIKDKMQNEFTMQSQDYRSSLLGTVIIFLTGIWMYFRLNRG